MTFFGNKSTFTAKLRSNSRCLHEILQRTAYGAFDSTSTTLTSKFKVLPASG
jgi:hypothetical protein